MAEMCDSSSEEYIDIESNSSVDSDSTTRPSKEQYFVKERHKCNTRFRCTVCSAVRASKSSVLKHLHSSHKMSPIKRKKKIWKENPAAKVPRSTKYRWCHNGTYGENLKESLSCSKSMSVDQTEEIFTGQEHLYTNIGMCESPSKSSNFNIDSDSSYISSSTDMSDEETDIEASNTNYVDTVISESSEEEKKQLGLLAFLVKHNLSGDATKDLLNLIKMWNTDKETSSRQTLERLLSTNDVVNKEIHYCNTCPENSVFPECPDIVECSQTGCAGLRYKGPLSKQNSENRQPQHSFIIPSIAIQFKNILECGKNWKEIQKFKHSFREETTSHIKDISSGQEYKKLNQEGKFLSGNCNISVMFNTDGIPLYNSSSVKLWPIYLAINELPISKRYLRENMIIAGIWQGKGKPPFEIFISYFAKEMKGLHQNGFSINIEDNPITVKVTVILGTMDLQAKAYVLRMTQHNGIHGCSTCEEPGQTERQGRGFARHYPYRHNEEDRYPLRDSDDIKTCIAADAIRQNKAKKSIDKVRIKGIYGNTGLSILPDFDLVNGPVPDYMHGVLLGVTSSLLAKFFSPSSSRHDYYIGRYIGEIGHRLTLMRPPDYVQRLPRNLEEQYNHFKASELESFLLFYGIPCLTGFLPEKYLLHFSLLSEAIYILLGDAIEECEIQKAEKLLDSFYKQYADLYGSGSVGLNVHNIGVHLVPFVKKWGPLWAWSCFAFEDLNHAILESVHGTGDVKKQIIRNKHLQQKAKQLANKLNVASQHGTRQLFNTGKSWSSVTSYGKCSVAGALKPLEAPNEYIYDKCGALNQTCLKKVSRIAFNGDKFYSEQYKRMEKRNCHTVLLSDGKICSVSEYYVNEDTNLVFANVKYFNRITPTKSHFASIGAHLIPVQDSSEKDIICIEKFIEKLFFIQVDTQLCVVRMPNLLGKLVLK